jgi:hypothetical protein
VRKLGEARQDGWLLFNRKSDWPTTGSERASVGEERRSVTIA